MDPWGQSCIREQIIGQICAQFAVIKVPDRALSLFLNAVNRGKNTDFAQHKDGDAGRRLTEPLAGYTEFLTEREGGQRGPELTGLATLPQIMLEYIDGRLIGPSEQIQAVRLRFHEVQAQKHPAQTGETALTSWADTDMLLNPGGIQ